MNENGNKRSDPAPRPETEAYAADYGVSNGNKRSEPAPRPETEAYAADYGVTIPTDPVGVHTSVTAPTGHALQPTNNVMGGGRAFGYGAEDEREVIGTRTGWFLSLALAGFTSFFVIKYDLPKNIMKAGWVATIFALYIAININK